ncbi:hypothetical protein [Macrococcoides canis]|uniref:hypothetical protein n=1 Tax=Macrococcoides canis TaxID=1855823 RepID=UPI0020B8169B|nr:hypothetical protein [Macrococcus canis]UTG99312.1 hypothetical protein KFV04_07300 [Macrococcus canis]
MKKSVVMKNAWTIAKQGAKKFGGKAVEYIGLALKQAWNLAKQLSGKKQYNNLKGFITPAQERFIVSLMNQAENKGIDVFKEFDCKAFLEEGPMYSKQSASELITELKGALA